MSETNTMLGNISQGEMTPGTFAVITDSEETESETMFGAKVSTRYARHLYGEVLRIVGAMDRFVVVEILTGHYAGQHSTLEVNHITLTYPEPEYKEARLKAQAEIQRRALVADKKWWQFWIR